MDFFNEINLKGNELSNTVISTSFDATAVAGAIKYVSGSPGQLQYYNGTTWIPVGSSETNNYNVNGTLKFKPGSNAAGNTWNATVAVDAANATLVEINYESNKGQLIFSNNGDSTNYVAVTLPTPDSIISSCIATGSFSISSTNGASPYTITVTHSLGTQSVQATLYIEYTENLETVYQQVLCEVIPISTTQVRFILNSNPSSSAYGTYHFTLVGSSRAASILPANITVTGTV